MSIMPAMMRSEHYETLHTLLALYPLKVRSSPGDQTDKCVLRRVSGRLPEYRPLDDVQNPMLAVRLRRRTSDFPPRISYRASQKSTSSPWSKVLTILKCSKETWRPMAIALV